MRVLHLVGQPEDNGGILSVIRGIQQATAGHGIRHVVWVREGYEEKRGPGLEYRFSRKLVSDSPSHLQLLRGAWGACGELGSMRRAERFDVLHAHSRGGFLVALKCATLDGIRVLFTNHAYARRTGMYRFASRQENFSTVVLTSNMGRHYGLKAGCDRVRIIPACCADSFFELPLKQAGRGGDGILSLVGIGNVVRWKAWDLVLKAISELTSEERDRVQFEHWGPVPRDDDSPKFERELRQYCAKNGLERNVFWRGSTRDVGAVLEKADWFVIPSTDEPCSVALMEALAVGIPVLATESGGNMDLVRHGRSGLLFRAGDVQDLAAKLRSILRGEIRLDPPQEIRQSVRDKSASVVGAAYARLYADLAAGRVL